ncbi:MAG: ABC transporter permease [Candidatus Sumerlaeaceae bacterium]|nr:ABC transporter permease [Candidatus Sumerlaeaceae bacterium]
MSNIYRLLKKEVAGYINSPSTYIFLIIFLITGSCLFFYVNSFFKAGQATLVGFFIYIPWLFLFFVPAIAMRIWAEEKKAGTQELLMTMPVRDFEVVLGKYLGAFVLLLAALVCTFPLPILIHHFADKNTPIDWGPIWCAYLGALLFGSTILAIGTWTSSLTENQIIAFILGCSISFALILVGYPFVAGLLPYGEVISGISPYTHFVSMYRGVIDSSDIVYYLSAIAFFLFLNTRSVESRKWK